jgi:hypothetical protein
MADIDVVKKDSRSRLWLWILMIAVIAFVLWFLMARSRPRQIGSWLDEAQPSVGIGQTIVPQGGAAHS